MLPWNISEIAALTSGKIMNFSNQLIDNISIDTRTLQKGDLYVAIRGQRWDGHQFISKAARYGASAVLVERPYPKHIPQVIVKDTTVALGQLGKAQRLQWNGQVIAITGSVGKTTVKEMISHILEERFSVLKNDGNFNNQFGVPLTLLKLKAKHQVAIVELGINHPGEMEILSEIARPDIAVITMIGDAHIGNFNGKRELTFEKLKIAQYLNSEGKLIINNQPLPSRVDFKNKIYFGLQTGSLHAEQVVSNGSQIRFVIVQGKKKWNGILNLMGEFQVLNAVAAVTTTFEMGCSISYSLKKLKTFQKLPPMRMQQENRKGILFLNDAYNASPVSMKSALETVMNLKIPGKKILVLGDMLELGKWSQKEHQRIIDQAMKIPHSNLILYGSQMIAAFQKRQHSNQTAILMTENLHQVAQWIRTLACPNDLVFLKASHACHLENVLREV